MTYRTGDIVETPSGPATVAYYDRDADTLVYCGWPRSMSSDLSTVRLETKATDASFLGLFDEIWKQGGNLAQRVMALHGDEANVVRKSLRPRFRIIEDASGHEDVVQADDAETALEEFLDGRNFSPDWPDGDLYFVEDESGARTTFEVSTDWSPSLTISEKRSA